MTESFKNEKYTEYLDYLYKRANKKYPDRSDTDNLVKKRSLPSS